MKLVYDKSLYHNNEKLANCINLRDEYETTHGESKKYVMLMEKIKDEGPFDALGYFEVDKTTLTAAVGTVATYLIILIQFNLC